MDNDADNTYANLPPFTGVKDPMEEGDVLHDDNDVKEQPVGAAKDVSDVPDSPLVDGNADEANSGIEDTAEEA